MKIGVDALEQRSDDSGIDIETKATSAAEL